MKFLEYGNHFSELSYSNAMNSDDLEEDFKTKKTRLQKIRGELNEIVELNEIEIVKLWNLAPASIEEAVSLIPALERLRITGKETKIQEAIDIIQKNTPVETNN